MTSLACVLLCANAAIAQTVRIQNEANEFGFGWMFSNSGTCYVILPSHVASDSFFLTLRTAAPVTSGSATVIRPFWNGMDLALAVARGGIEPRCVETADRLQASPTAKRASRAQLERLTPAGEIDRTPITIEDREYLTFTGVVAPGETGIGQGTSGAFAFAQGEPIGMAITSDADDRATFMRIEEIALNVQRYISEHGTAFRTTTAPAIPSTETADRLTLRLESASNAPINPAFPAEAVLGDGQYVFEARGRPTLVLAIDGDTGVGLSRLVFNASKDAGYGMPRDIKIEFSPFPDARRWFNFGTFQMGPDGVLDTGEVQPRSARMIRITVRNVWGQSPVVLDSVAAFGG